VGGNSLSQLCDNRGTTCGRCMYGNKFRLGELAADTRSIRDLKTGQSTASIWTDRKGRPFGLSAPADRDSRRTNHPLFSLRRRIGLVEPPSSTGPGIHTPSHRHQTGTLLMTRLLLLLLLLSLLLLLLSLAGAVGDVAETELYIDGAYTISHWYVEQQC